MRFILKGGLYVCTVLFSSYLITGIHFDSVVTAIWFSLILGILNMILGSILKIIASPIILMTMGLFTFIIDSLMILLAARLLDGVVVQGFLSALFCGLLIFVINKIFQPLIER